MANEIPEPLLEAMWLAVIDGNPVMLQATDSTHGYVSGTTQFMGELSGGSFLGTAELLTETVTGADLTVLDDSIAGINTSEFVDAVFVYADTGNPATSPILTFVDTLSDNTDMNKEGDGGGMGTVFPAGLVARI